MTLFCIDPGTLQSALVVLETRDGDVRVRESTTILNEALLPRLEHPPVGAALVIEKFQARGMPIGNDSVETMLWSGRFFQAWPSPSTRYWLTRQAVKIHLTGLVTSNDANVRTTLLDRFGPGRELAIGTVKNKGPLHGVRAHEYAALAVGITWIETHDAASVRTMRYRAASGGILMEAERRAPHEAMPLLPPSELQRKP